MMTTTKLLGTRVHHGGNFGSDARDGEIVAVSERDGMVQVRWDDGRLSWELSALLGLPSGLRFAAGDVFERGGAVLEVSKVERAGQSVLVHFVRYGSTPINPLRVKASAVVHVARPVWL